MTTPFNVIKTTQTNQAVKTREPNLEMESRTTRHADLYAFAKDLTVINDSGSLPDMKAIAVKRIATKTTTNPSTHQQRVFPLFKAALLEKISREGNAEEFLTEFNTRGCSFSTLVKELNFQEIANRIDQFVKIQPAMPQYTNEQVSSLKLVLWEMYTLTDNNLIQENLEKFPIKKTQAAAPRKRRANGSGLRAMMRRMGSPETNSPVTRKPITIRPVTIGSQRANSAS